MYIVHYISDRQHSCLVHLFTSTFSKNIPYLGKFLGGTVYIGVPPPQNLGVGTCPPVSPVVYAPDVTSESRNNWNNLTTATFV